MSNKKYIMALDQGTTSSRCIIFDKSGNIVSTAQREFPQIYPQPGWVEHNPYDIWSSQLYSATQAMKNAGISAREIDSIGITNQRETTFVWDRNTGAPLCNAIVWQCRRTADYCKSLTDEGFDKIIHEKTGLVADPYFSATKLKWIFDNIPGAYDKAKNGELCFGTSDSWLLWMLTDGKVHATDYSNASRTMIFNIHTLDWDEELLCKFGIPKEVLPRVLPSSGMFGYTDEKLFGEGIAITGVAGDQQSALFGQTCFDVGDAKNTYGTGCFMLMNTGEKNVDSQNGLLTTVAWNINGVTTYALEGSVFSGGCAVQWLRDELGIIKDSAQSEEYALRVPDTNGVYVVPAFTGLGAPYWDQYARGTVCGLTRGANKYHLTRAVLESIAYQTNAVLSAMIKDSGLDLKTLKVDGGASANDFLMQFQSDVTDAVIERPLCIESTALGAAFLAGLHTGFFKDKEQLKEIHSVASLFSPKIDEYKRESLISGWDAAVARAVYSTDK